MSSDQSHKFSMLPKIMNGGIAGIVGVSVVFPLDLIKTRLQNQTIGPDGKKQSLLDFMKKTYRAEGYFGMYKGSGVNILLIAPEKAIKLAANDFFRYHLASSNGEPLTTARGMLAGGLAGLFQLVVTTPMELLKIRMQEAGQVMTQAKQAGKNVPKITATSLAKQLIKDRGFFGLYTGISATALRDVPFSISYFPLFAKLNSLGPRKQDASGESVFYWSFLSGFTSASISALAVTPFDVVKTRLQALKTGQGEPHYTGVSDVIFKIYKYEGVKAFFKGGALRIMVLAPLFGIAQTFYYIGVAEYILGIK